MEEARAIFDPVHDVAFSLFFFKTRDGGPNRDRGVDDTRGKGGWISTSMLIEQTYTKERKKKKSFAIIPRLTTRHSVERKWLLVCCVPPCFAAPLFGYENDDTPYSVQFV